MSLTTVFCWVNVFIWSFTFCFFGFVNFARLLNTPDDIFFHQTALAFWALWLLWNSFWSFIFRSPLPVCLQACWTLWTHFCWRWFFFFALVFRGFFLTLFFQYKNTKLLCYSLCNWCNLAIFFAILRLRWIIVLTWAVLWSTNFVTRSHDNCRSGTMLNNVMDTVTWIFGFFGTGTLSGGLTLMDSS
jgi:hypothetical protein